MGVMISRELKREVVANARKRNAFVIRTVQRIYDERLRKAVRRGVIQPENAPAVAQRLAERIRKELSL